MKVKIYGLFNPSGSIRYVGKTRNSLRQRLQEHIAYAKRNPEKHDHKLHWIRFLLAKGEEPYIRLLEEVREKEWQIAERKWITELRRAGVNLTNTSEGGLGGNGLHGEKNPRAKLSETDVVVICEKYAGGGYTQAQLADEYGVAITNVSAIVRGISWPDVDRLITKTGNAIYGERHHGSKLTAQIVADIRSQYAKGIVTYDDLAEKYGVHPVTIGDVIRGTSWATV